MTLPKELKCYVQEDMYNIGDEVIITQWIDEQCYYAIVNVSKIVITKTNTFYEFDGTMTCQEHSKVLPYKPEILAKLISLDYKKIPPITLM